MKPPKATGMTGACKPYLPMHANLSASVLSGINTAARLQKNRAKQRKMMVKVKKIGKKFGGIK